MTSFDNSTNENVPRVDWLAGSMQGVQIQELVKKLGELPGVFRDQGVWEAADPETVVYKVQWWAPVAESTEGGLLWGTTTIEPGLVGDEYFMTRGHFHAIRDRGEYYCTVRSCGVLVLMTQDGSTRTETMSPGSLHYIPGHTAHRVVNTSDSPLIFWASWPSDAGHDYDGAASFGIRVLLRNGVATFVPE
ncbi:MAG TPA: glucose-6-phosphate isomerase family protein [Acidobacteriaceae bacterium]